MRGNNKLDRKIQLWREKAKIRSKEIGRLNKRLKEVKQSRQNWKEKYMWERAARLELVGQIDKRSKQQSKERISRHTYSSQTVELCLRFRHLAGCSYRSCVQLLYLFQMYFDIECRCPSASSIRNWNIKMGLHQVEQWHVQSIETSEWGLIIDESISMGGQKLLVILGVNLQTHSFDHPLCMQDIHIFAIRPSDSWKGPAIKQVIEELKSKGLRIAYCCSDNGNNLRKALKMSNIIHIEDCTHALGKVLERRYKNEEMFIQLSKQSALFKRQEHLSQYAAFVPPVQRSKARFMNLFPLIKWAK